MQPVTKITFSAVLLVLTAISDTTFVSYLLGYLLNLFSEEVVSKISVNTVTEVKLLLYYQQRESEFILSDRNDSLFTTTHRSLEMFEI